MAPSLDSRSSHSFPGTGAAALAADPRVAGALDALGTAVRDHADRLAPRPSTTELSARYGEWLQRSAEVRGRELLYPYLGSGLGRGALVELGDGSVKWDLITGIGVHFFGHSDEDLIRAALEGALDDAVKHGNLQAGLAPTQFAERLVRLAQRQSRLQHCFLSTSGAMANENAFKVALQKHAPASRILAFENCFMGRSIVMSQIGDSAANRMGIPLNVLVDYMPFWNPAAAERMGKSRFIDMAVMHLEQYLDRYPKQHACFVFELIQGEGGFQPGDRDYFRALMELCKERGVAVWDDEIQTFGRGEEMFAYEYFDLGEYVDLFCVGKMTQTCATLFTEAYNPKPGLLSGTFLGDSVAFRVGERILERLEGGGFYGSKGLFAQHHQAFREQVAKLQERHPEWFPAVPGLGELSGGLGGMMRFTPFGGRKDAIMGACKSLFAAGAVAFWCGHGPHHLRLLPPLPALELDQWPVIFAVIEEGLGRYAATLSA